MLWPSLVFSANTWYVPASGIIFEAAPTLKYAEDVRLYSGTGSTIGDSYTDFLSNFSAMKKLWLNCNAFRQFDWTFLDQESARELQMIKLAVFPSSSTKNMCSSVEALVRFCATLPRRQDEEALELDLSQTGFSRAFGLRIIKVST